MNQIKFRSYRDEDYELIQEFLQQSYALNGMGYSWMVDRWNFTRSVSRCMNGLTLDEWEDRVLVGEENGNIVVVVNSEGENQGEAFFQLIRDDYPNETIKQMFDFVEDKLYVTEKGLSTVSLRIKDSMKVLQQEALDRGFVKQEWSEPISELTMNETFNLAYELPEGYNLVSGKSLTGQERASLHREAFGYDADKVLEKRCGIGFKTMEIQPFYNSHLDMVVKNEVGLPVAFANVWYDPLNHISIIEPVGTHKDYRKMGLAKAAIYEGLKRSKELGARKAYVGSDQKFYKAIGFEVKGHLHIYKKVIKQRMTT